MVSGSLGMVNHFVQTHPTVWTPLEHTHLATEGVLFSRMKRLFRNFRLRAACLFWMPERKKVLWKQTQNWDSVIGISPSPSPGYWCCYTNYSCAQLRHHVSTIQNISIHSFWGLHQIEDLPTSAMPGLKLHACHPPARDVGTVPHYLPKVSTQRTLSVPFLFRNMQNAVQTGCRTRPH